MNGLALLGAASTCNAVSWNGKYWLASIEGDSVGGGQTQVYSLNGMSWIASNNGDELFSSTSQALALATIKTGGAGAGANNVITNLQSDVATLQATQFGVGQKWYNLSPSLRPHSTFFYNNTDKLMFINVTMNNGSGFGMYVYVNTTQCVRTYNNNLNVRLAISFVVPAGASYYWTNWGTMPTISAWYEFR